MSDGPKCCFRSAKKIGFQNKFCNWADAFQSPNFINTPTLAASYFKIVIMTKILKISILLTFASIGRTYATTWDEPWANKVIKEASSFVLAKIISTKPDKGIRIFVLKTLGGIKLTDTLLIDNFYLLHLCSRSSGHDAEFNTQGIDTCYFFLKQNSENQFCIATPTTGFDYVSDGKVAATFRHSYHQAAVPSVIYEKAMSAVFNNYHNLEYDTAFIKQFVIENLNKSPAGFGKEEIGLFFLQHVALECIYHLKLNIDETLPLPFLDDKNNFHSQVSAARAMISFDTESNRMALLRAIGDTTKRNFVRVMCVWSIGELKPTKYKTSLLELERTASDETDNFGGDFMDPRVCTYVPNLKKSLHDLVEKL